MFEDFRLKVFTAVAEEGNFTKAASRIGVSQPAVSQNIAELEKNFGVKLFERQRGYVELTQEGAIFKSYAEKILRSYDELITIFSNYSTIASAERLRACVAPSHMQLFSSCIIPYIYTLVPSVSLEISTDSEEDADFKIASDGSFSASPDFAANPLCHLLRTHYLSVKPE